MNTFKFVGQIKRIEEKSDKKFIETLKFQTGWMMEKIKFRMLCGESTEFIELVGGCWQQDSKNAVYTFFNKPGDANKQGETNKIEKVQIPWADRFDPAIIEKVPKYKRYTVDLSSDKIREELVAANKSDEAQALTGLKYTFISNYDFALKVEDLLINNKFGDDLYVVSGNVEYTYSNKNDKPSYYRSFVPTSIYKASKDDVAGAYGRMDLYYVKEDVIGQELENGDVPINGYLQFYDRTAKGNFYTPIGLIVKGDSDKKDGFVNLFKKLGDDEAESLVLGVNVSYFNGAEKVTITEDDFTEEQKTLISWGLKTKEEIIRELGGNARGDKINYIYIESIARGYSSGPQKSDVARATLEATPDKGVKNGEEELKGVKIDLFEDDDDEI